MVEPRDVHTLESQACEFCLCDNRWHSVHAVMAEGRLTLRVDAVTVTDLLTSPSLDLHHELFIGGHTGTSVHCTSAHISHKRVVTSQVFYALML